MQTLVRRLSSALILVVGLTLTAHAQKIDFVALTWESVVDNVLVSDVDSTTVLDLHDTSSAYLAGDTIAQGKGVLVEGIAPPATVLCPQTHPLGPVSLTSINKSRTIAGHCVHNGTVQGFLRTTSQAFTWIHHPNATATFVQGHNDANLVVGFYREQTTGQLKALHWQKGVYSTFVPRVPHALVALYGVNNKGHLVGIYDDAAGRHGFLFQKGLTPSPFVLLEVPGALEVYPLDINDQGQILGAYVTPEFGWTPFLWEAGEFKTTTVPGARFFSPNSLTNDGRVAGSVGILADDGVTWRNVGLIAQGLDWAPLTPTLATLMARSAGAALTLQMQRGDVVETKTGSPLCQPGARLGGKLAAVAQVVCAK